MWLKASATSNVILKKTLYYSYFLNAEATLDATIPALLTLLSTYLIFKWNDLPSHLKFFFTLRTGHSNWIIHRLDHRFAIRAFKSILFTCAAL